MGSNKVTSESELSVDELLHKSAIVEGLLSRLEDDCSDGLIGESREMLTETQNYIENNKAVIPSYTLKKVNDLLKKLETILNRPKKSMLKFKFKTDLAPRATLNNEVHKPKEKIASSTVTENLFGFRDTTNQRLYLEGSEVESKDISLVNLDNCIVKLSGFANTVYIHELKNTSVVIHLACRAVTIKSCVGCSFEIICQQLRIDSTYDCKLQIFVSARSMLEASKGLEFRQLNILYSEQKESDGHPPLQELMERANFKTSENNWKCIDDFDWLSPDRPSKNFTIVE